MSEPVAWDLAQRVAARVAGRDPFEGSYHLDSLLPDFEELTAEAEELVATETGLRSLSGPARVRVADRAGWVAANIRAFRRLISPLADRIDLLRSDDSMGAKATRSVSGVELGVLLGWMSTRVLGQYDLLVVDEDPADQDIVYYVGPNVLSLEKRYAFPPREFRLWLALHEVTHRAQFTGIPWLRDHYLALVDEIVGGVDPDPQHLIDALRRAVAESRAGGNPLQHGGLVGLLASDEQRRALERVGGMMSLLEGHGDVTMDRAGLGRVPSAERFSRVLRARRATRSGAAKAIQRLVGIEAKLRQYESGERFVAAVEEAGGPELLARAWEQADNLPTLAEVQEPALWLARVGGRS